MVVTLDGRGEPGQPLTDLPTTRNFVGPILAVAGGSGLAPIKSIVETALRRGMTQDIHLYAGARDEADVYLDRHFIDLAQRYPSLRYVTVLSAPEPGAATTRRVGLVSDAVGEDFRNLQGFKAHVAGPLPMVAATVAVLRALGMRDSDIHADALGASDAAATGIKGRSEE